MTGRDSGVSSSAFPCASTSPGFLSEGSSDEGHLLLSKFLSHSRRVSNRPPHNDREIASTKPHTRNTSVDVETVRDWQTESTSKNDNGSRPSSLRISLDGIRESLSIRHNNSKAVPASSQEATRYRPAGILPPRKVDQVPAVTPIPRDSNPSPVRIAAPGITVAVPGQQSHAANLKVNTNKSPVRKPLDQRDGSPLKRQQKPNGLERGSDRGLAAKRPRRSHVGPINYYKNHYSGYDSGDEENILKAAGTVTKSGGRPSAFMKRASHHVDTPGLALYSSNDVEIYRKALVSLDEFPDLTHAPYAPEHAAARYASRFRKTPTSQVLHVAFDLEEMAAMLKLILPQRALSGFADMSIVDQVVQAVQSRSEKHFPNSMAARISHMNRLNEMLAECGVGDFNAFFLGMRSGELAGSLNPKTASRIARLASDLLWPLPGCDGSVTYSVDPAEFVNFLQPWLRLLSLNGVRRAILKPSYWMQRRAIYRPSRILYKACRLAIWGLARPHMMGRIAYQNYFVIVNWVLPIGATCCPVFITT
jgi:hypothetical protein